MDLPFEFGPTLLCRESDGTPIALVYVSPIEDLILAKADLAPNERWVTLSPHKAGGEKGEGHVHVKVKVGPDGSAHVITGPGELRGLRLTRLATPEQLAERRQARQEEAKAAKKQAKEDGAKKEQASLEESAADPEAAQRHAQEKLAAQAKQKSIAEKHSQLEEDMKQLHGQLLEHAAKVTGDEQYRSGVAQAGMDEAMAERYKGQQQTAAQDWYARHMPPTSDEDPATTVKDAKGAGSVVAANNIRRISSSLKALRRDLVSSLVKDPELRAAVLGADDEVPLPVSEHVSGTPGYQRQTSAQAAEQGFTPDDAKKEAGQVFDNRMAGLRQMGQGEKAEAITDLRAGTQRRAAVLRAMKNAPDPAGLATTAPVSKVTPQEVKEHADDVRHFLQLHNKLQELERQKRALSLGSDPDALDKEKEALGVFDQEPGAGAEIGSSVSQVEDAFAEKLDREINDAAKADTTRAFLDSVNEDAVQGGYASDLIRKAMMSHIGTGAYAHLSNAAQVALGHEGLDRQVVDALGTDAAAQLVAHAMRRDLNPDALSDVRSGLAQAHAEGSLTRMKDAMDLASAARATTAEIHLPAVTSGLDAAMLADLQRQKKEAIGQAHEALGTALGEVEAGAALNLSLKGGSRANMTVRMGDVPTAQAAMQLRALGLQDGEYTLAKDPETGALTATLSREGMDRLTQPQDEQARANADIASRIKSGAEDAPTYLPPGFMARDSAELASQPEIPRSFAAPPDFSHGAAAAVSSVAASLYADGKTPSQILNHLFDVTAQDVPPGQEGDFSQAVTGLIPFTQAVQRTAKDGTTYTAQEALDVDNDPQVKARLSDLARQHVAEHAPGEADFNAQRLDGGMQTKDALFRALASDPALQAAFTPPADLGGSPEGRQQAMAIRNYAMRTLFKDRLGGLAPKDFDRAQQAKQDQAIDACGPAPEKWGEAEGSLFGGPSDDAARLSLNPHATPEQQAAALKEYGLGPEHYTLSGTTATLNDAGKAALKVPDNGMTVTGEAGGDAVVQGGLDNLNPQWVAHQRKVAQARKKYATTSDLWNDFKITVGGPRAALKAVQEVMKGDLAQRFAAQHAALTGQQLRVSTATTENWERRLAATDPQAAEDVRRRDRAYMDAVRQRDSSGRYGQMGEGGVTAAVQAHVEKLARAKLMQGGLGFGDLMDARGGGEIESRDVRHLQVGPHERVTLGSTAESQLADLTRQTRWGMKPGDGPVDLIPDLGWGKGTKHVGKQRGVKMLSTTGRLLGFYGAGCVRGDTELTDAETGETLSFHEWMVQGRAPKVVSLQNNQPVIAQASVPFIKGTEPMYRVTLKSGKTVVVTAAHKFLTQEGWRKLGELDVGSLIGITPTS